jgi:hypothetical protein
LEFDVIEVVQEVCAVTDYQPSTVRTHVVSVMRRGAPEHHATTFDDLERVSRGRYRRIQ